MQLDWQTLLPSTNPHGNCLKGEHGHYARRLSGQPFLSHNIFRQHPKGRMPMGPDPSTIIHSKWDQFVAPSVIDRHRFEGVLVCLELHVFNLFGRKSWDGRNLMQNRVTVDSSDHPINTEVASSLCKVQDHDVTRAGAIFRSHTPGFLHD